MKDGDDMRSLRGTWAFRVTARGKSADRVSFSEGENVVHLPEPQVGSERGSAAVRTLGATATC